MPDNNLKDKLIGTIQRDRLSAFFKEADERSSGCFYFSLANIYHFLNPGKILPRNFEQEVLKNNPDLGVKPSEVFARVSQLRYMLGLEISKVVILDTVNQDIDEVRDLFRVPDEIPTEKTTDTFIQSPNGMISMIYWQREDHHAHFSSINNGYMEWQDSEGSTFSRGGQNEADFLKEKSFSPMVVLHFKKTIE